MKVKRKNNAAQRKAIARADRKTEKRKVKEDTTAQSIRERAEL